MRYRALLVFARVRELEASVAVARHAPRDSDPEGSLTEYRPLAFRVVLRAKTGIQRPERLRREYRIVTR